MFNRIIRFSAIILLCSQLFLLGVSKSGNITKVDLFWNVLDRQSWHNFFILDTVKSRFDGNVSLKITCLVNENKGVFNSKNGPLEIEESKKIAVIEQIYPDKLFDYIKARFLIPTPNGWDDALRFVGIDYAEFNRHLKSSGNNFLKKHIKYAKLKGIAESVILINSVPYSGTVQVMPLLKEINSTLTGSRKILVPSAKATQKKQTLKLFIIESNKGALGKEDENISAGLKNLFASVDLKTQKISYSKSKTMSAFKNLNVSFLPFYVLEKNRISSKTLAFAVKSGLVKEQGKFYTVGSNSNDGIFVKNKLKKNILTLFTMTQCPFGVEALKILASSKEKNLLPANTIVNVHYIVDFKKDKKGRQVIESLHGAAEWEEAVRQLLIKKYYPSKFWKYLAFRNKNPDSSRWELAAEKAGIDDGKIRKNFDKGIELLKENAAYANNLKIKSSPMFLWQNRFLAGGLDGLKKLKGFEGVNVESNIKGSCK